MVTVYESNLVIDDGMEDFHAAMDQQVVYIERGVYFPAEVLNNTKLSWSARYLFAIIKNFHSADRKCFASNRWFSQYLNCTEQYVSNSIKELEKQSYIKRKIINFRYVDRSTNQVKFKAKRIIEIDDSYKKIYSGSITKVIANNIISNNTISNIVSKDTIDTPLSVVHSSCRFVRKKKSTTKRSRLVDYWNRIEWCRSHSKIESKIYKECARLFNLLKQGKFSKGRELCFNWLKNHKHLVEKEWTEKELKTAINRLSLYFKEGYWPEDKSRMPKDLLSLIYNPRSKKSLLLSAYENPPTLLSDQQLLPVEEDPDQTEMFAEILYGGNKVKADDLSNKKLSELIYAVNEVVQYHEWIRKVVIKKHPWLEINLKKRGLLSKYYIEFLTEERYPNMEIEPYMLGPKSPANNWYQFLGYLAECFVDGDKKDAYIFKKEHYK